MGSIIQHESLYQNKFKSPNSSTLAAISLKSNLNQNDTNSTSRLLLNKASSFSTNFKFQPIIQQNLAKKKTTGYCECCKQRYENLNQHLNSAQHDTFERNQSNFKEIDIYINGILNFKQFLGKRNK